jgi:TRAP-type mannitol/chloroaromatic compound transport system substrate-binding protein
MRPVRVKRRESKLNLPVDADGGRVENLSSRRRFLKSAAVATVASAALAFPNSSRAQAATLKVQTAWRPQDIFHEMARQYTDRVEAMSGGRLKIQLLAVNDIAKIHEIQDAVHKGVLDGAYTATVTWYDRHKAASLFGTGPVFGTNAAQLLAWIHRGGGKELYRELVQGMLKLNLVGFFSNPVPTQPLGWFKEEIKSPEQLRGLRYRTVGLAMDVMQAMGLEVLRLPGPGVIPAFKRGVLDAFEFNNPTSDRQLGAQDVAKHYMLGSFHQASELFEIILNKDKFESLPKEHQAILEYSAEAAGTANYALAMDRHSQDLEELITKDGVDVHRTPQAVMEEQLKAWDKIIAELMKDSFSKKVIDSQRAWARRVAFYDLLNAADYRLAYKHYFPNRVDF